MDVTVVVLPMPVLWGLKMAVGRKIVLSIMFGLGVMYISRLPLTPICDPYPRKSSSDKPQYLCHNAHSHRSYHGTYVSESSLHHPANRVAIPRSGRMRDVCSRDLIL